MTPKPVPNNTKGPWLNPGTNEYTTKPFIPVINLPNTTTLYECLNCRNTFTRQQLTDRTCPASNATVTP